MLLAQETLRRVCANQVMFPLITATKRLMTRLYGPKDRSQTKSQTLQIFARPEKNVWTPEILPSGDKIGKFFQNPLTKDGYKYLQEFFEEDPHNEMAQFYKEFYGEVSHKK